MHGWLGTMACKHASRINSCLKAALTMHLLNMYILTNVLLLVRQIEWVKIDIKTMIKPKNVGKTTERDKIGKLELCELDIILIMQKYFENDSSFCLNIM